MMDRSERNALFKSVTTVIRETVTAAESSLRKWVSDEIKAVVELFEERAKALPSGKDGKDGRDGIDGKDGAPGGDGKNGMDGKDADLTEVRQFIGSEVEKAMAAIPKPQDGQPGRDGKDGESIHPDTVSLMVAKELRAVLADWPKPQDGRDGIQLETIPFHQDKTYARGACVAFGGGTWRAFRETTAGTPSSKNGWEVILNGYHPPEIVQSDDGRTVKHIIRMTDGTVVEKDFYYSGMLHRGVYEANTEYLRGDCVTYAGSTWHCVVDVTKVVPGTTTKDWQLIAKRGGDGKDLRPQEKTITQPLSLK